MRYPGSKTKLLPIINEYLDKTLVNSKYFVDVFVGGGSVLLDVAKRYPKIELFANDKDYSIYSFWKIVGGTDSKKLSDLLGLMAQPVTLEHFYKLRSAKANDDVDSAYRAIFFNRTCFSGIVNSGPIGGKEQKSKYTVDCRYNFKKLKDKILACNKLLSGRLTIENEDFSNCKSLLLSDSTIYLDPPYVDAGKELYPVYMNNLEHQNLGDILLSKKNWVLSYDDSNIIRRIYQNCNIYNTDAKYCINGAKTTWSPKNELIITPKF